MFLHKEPIISWIYHETWDTLYIHNIHSYIIYTYVYILRNEYIAHCLFNSSSEDKDKESGHHVIVIYVRTHDESKPD